MQIIVTVITLNQINPLVCVCVCVHNFEMLVGVNSYPISSAHTLHFLLAVNLVFLHNMTLRVIKVLYKYITRYCSSY